MERIKRYLYGGQDERFFQEHRELIREHNSKMAGLVITVLLVVSLFYFVFDLNSGGDRTMRMTYLAFMLVFFVLHMTFEYFYKKNRDSQRIVIIVLSQFVFMFLLLVGPIYDSGNLACFIPVYFIVIFLLFITPMHFTGIIALLDLIVFIIADVNFKSDRLATYDMIDAVTCLILGITVGQGILKDRLHEIEAFSILNAKNATELEKALAIANKDALTGVRSRIAFETYKDNLNATVAKNENIRLGAVMLDANFLKKVNDRDGHDAGDQYLLQCARLICNLFRHSPVFRIGGDEFLVFLQGEDFENRALLMQELRKKAGSTESPISLSSGLAEFDPFIDTKVESMIERADLLMYKNKLEIKGEDSTR